MFDFENLEVYKKAKVFNAIIRKSILLPGSLDATTKNQLRRASLSIVLNTSRFSKADRKNFCVIARGSVFKSQVYEGEKLIEQLSDRLAEKK